MLLILATIFVCFLVALIIVLSRFGKILISQLRIYNVLQKIPGPPSDNNVLTGNIGAMSTSPDKIFKVLRQWASLHYPIYKTYLMFVCSVNIMSPEDFELVLSSTKHITKSPLYNFLMRWLGTGLLTSTGEKWHARRKILTPAFHFQVLDGFIDIFNEETQKLVEIFRDECHQPYIDVSSHIYQFTLNTIAETAMGVKLDGNSEEKISYKRAVSLIEQIFINRLMKPWLHPNYLYYYLTSLGRRERSLIKILHGFTQNVVTERRKVFQNVLADHNKDVNTTYSKRKRKAMLDLLLSTKNEQGNIDDEGIREEVDTFMFRGHDTTAAALSFALMLIACHSQIQERIVDEIKTVLRNNSKKPTYNDLQEMRYLERCIKEVLRLYPSVHYISRIIGEDLVSHSGYHLPKSTVVHLHIFDLHRNPVYFPEPDRFDPDRFLLENCQDRHPFAYVPFSAGPRNCIGQRFAMLELKAVLSGLILNFKLEPVDTPDTITLLADIVLRTKDGIRVKFVPR